MGSSLLCAFAPRPLLLLSVLRFQLYSLFYAESELQ